MLRDVQRVLIAALLADDPEAELRARLADARLTDAERRSLEAISPDGLRLSSLIVKKLRFERLVRGDGDLARLFEERPEEFMRLYREYAKAVPPEAYFPQEEGRLFRAWRGGVPGA